MKRFTRGLVVGKFAPLHRGHELVIRTALEHCAEVVVLSYSKPELPGCEPMKRARWLQALFPACTTLVLTDELLAAQGHRQELPTNEADDGTHRRFVAFVCTELLGRGVDAVFTSEAYGDGFARELGEYLRAPVEHVLVDPERRAMAISGSELRADVHAGRSWLSPEVYASFVARVCLLGGESSGKTLLAEALARHFGTAWVPEYGRELWLARSGRLEFGDLLRIAQEQVQREEQALRQAWRYVFCDTSPLTTLFYSRDLFASTEPELERLAERHYDLSVLCAPDFPFAQDGTRRDHGFRQRQHEFYETELERRGERYVLAEGSVERRVQAVAERLLDGVLVRE